MPPELSDNEAIRQLVARVAITFDERDIDGWVDCWSTEGTLTRLGGEDVKGHEALAEFVRHFPGRGRHVVTNSVIDVDGDRATHRAYVQYFDRDHQHALLLFGVYDDRLVRERGAWRLASRRTKTDAPVVLGAGAPVSSD